MLTCRDVVARSSALLDGELPMHDWWRVQAHQLICRHCRQFLRNLALLVRGLGRHGERQAVSAEFVERVLDAVPPEG
jgi:predicted anti-sigma-YlaC factor YlaD